MIIFQTSKEFLTLCSLYSKDENVVICYNKIKPVNIWQNSVLWSPKDQGAGAITQNMCYFLLLVWGWIPTDQTLEHEWKK